MNLKIPKQKKNPPTNLKVRMKDDKKECSYLMFLYFTENIVFQN